VELSPQEVREVRFGTTRMRAGYNMAEVDAFLDTIEAAIEAYSTQSQNIRDEAEALRSQVKQLQARLAGVQAELDECRSLADLEDDGHDTIVVDAPDLIDTETTAENPIISPIPIPDSEAGRLALLRVRDDVRRMLTEQLQLVEELDIETR
jgi:DivIVA domain-containing protein